MKQLLKVITPIFIALLPVVSWGQDLHFSQFYESAILRNPALTGVFSDDYKVGVLYRNQWSSISKPYQTGLLSAEVRVPVSKNINDFISFGLMSYYDKAGSINMQTFTAYPAINYNKSLEDEHGSFLSVGFTGGYLQRSFDPSQATFNNQYQNGGYSPTNPTGETLPNPKMSTWDLGAGISFNSNAGEDNQFSYLLGVAAYHFTKPKNSFYNYPGLNLETKWSVNAGFGYMVSETYSVQAHANVVRQGQYQEIILGGTIGWNRLGTWDEPAFSIYGGCYYRHGDAIIPTVKIRFRDYFIGVSYDVNLSKLHTASNLQGGYEISVFRAGMFPSRDTRGKVMCPRFFN